MEKIVILFFFSFSRVTLPLTVEEVSGFNILSYSVNKEQCKFNFSREDK